MDARDRLRRYLEQRRELGESELVLDGMAVDDVMTLLGARDAARSARNVRAPVSAMTPPAAPPSVGHADAVGDAQEPAAAVAPPPTPAPRFDTAVGGDWRQALSQPDPGAPASDANNAPRSPAAGAALPDWLVSLGIPAGITAGASALPAAQDIGVLPAAMTLDAVADLVRACTRCGLHASARNPVPGEGNASAELVCVGEAPGAHEDVQGRPFVGEAGQLLTRILSAIQLPRESVYICNVLKHRPPANRDPLPDEVAACQPFLARQLELIQPRVILALGRFAAQTLLGTATSLGKLRDHVHLYRGIPVIVTYHPAALLRNEAWKRPTWEDVKLARRILDASRAASGRASDR